VAVAQTAFNFTSFSRQIPSTITAYRFWLTGLRRIRLLQIGEQDFGVQSAICKENDKSTTDDLHCIRYTACSCLHSGSHFLCRSDASSTISLKKKSHSFSARMRLGYPHVLYNTGTNHRLKKHPSCMANPFHLLGMNQPVQGGWWLFDLQIPIGRNGQAEAKWDKHAVYRIQCRSSVVDLSFSA